MLPIPISSPALGSLIKTLPATDVLALANKIIDHKETMTRIEQAYRYQKKQLKYQYQLAIKKLDRDFEAFVILAEKQHDRFAMGHSERMKILTTIKRLTSQKMDTQTHALLNRLIEMYHVSTEQSVGVSDQTHGLPMQEVL